MSVRNIVKFVSICFIGCGAVMFFLYATMGHPNSMKNGFNRRLPVHKLQAGTVIDLKEEGYYIAGHSEKQIYLGNIKMPFCLFVSDSNLQHLEKLQLQFPEKVRYTWQAARIAVDPPYIYLSDGLTPKFFIGDLGSLKMDTFLQRSSYFNAAVNISPGSFAVRAVSADTKTNMFLKVQSDSPYVTMVTDVLKKQVDGMFCTDGKFKYDKASNRLVYMYYYRNECLLLDTNLHVINTIRTIDTTSMSKVTIANVSSDGEMTFSAPPAFVNAALCMDKEKIYVRSSLLADNEGFSTMNKNSVLDVYAAGDGHYIQSLYIPMQQHEPIRDMLIVNDQLIALYEHSYVVYKLAVAEKLYNRVGTNQ